MREWIEEIVENGSKEDMEELTDILIKSVKKLEKYDPECYTKMKMKIYKLAYGTDFTEEIGKDIVSKMKPYGEHWNLAQTSEVKNQYGLSDIDEVDFYIVMNMTYNDYHDMFGENLEMYVKFTKLFIQDEDVVDKVFKYVVNIILQ